MAYVEREAYAAAVLLARMEAEDLEPAPVWCGDLERLPAERFVGVDLVTAGFPCQPFSSASRGRRVAHDLWPDVRATIDELRPGWVLLENVASDPIVRAARHLEGLGYVADADRFDASEVGAPHRRRRFFLLAYYHGHRQRNGPSYAEVAFTPGASSAAGWEEGPGGVLGMDAGVPNRVDRLRAIGNSVCPQQAELAIRTLYGRLMQ